MGEEVSSLKGATISIIVAWASKEIVAPLKLDYRRNEEATHTHTPLHDQFESLDGNFSTFNIEIRKTLAYFNDQFTTLKTNVKEINDILK